MKLLIIWPLDIQDHYKLIGFFVNLPIGVLISISLKRYHLEHHRIHIF